MKKYLTILTFISLISCKNKNLAVTEKEVNAVQQVLDFYNGVCLRSKGIEIKNGIKKRSFGLEMSKSDLLDNYPAKLKSHSANIAYLFYSNLANEKSNYDEVKVKINLSNGVSSEFTYSDKELIEIENLEPQLTKVINLIVAKDYDNLTKQFDSTISIDKISIENMFVSLVNRFGKINKTQFQGFEFGETNDFGQIIEIKEAVTFEKITASMNVIFKRDNKQLISIEFP